MPFPRQTHTYVEMEVNPSTYDEIAKKLRDAGYGHCFNAGVIDMTGIAIKVDESQTALALGAALRKLEQDGY